MSASLIITICTNRLIVEYFDDFSMFMQTDHLFFRFKDHPTLNDRYLLLHLLGRGGFSEVYKVSFEFWNDMTCFNCLERYLDFTDVEGAAY